MARQAGLARGTLLGVIAQMWQLATAFVLYHFLSKELGPAGFGQWRVVLSVLMYFEAVVDTGLVKAATKRLAESPGDAPRLERAAYLGQGVLAAVLFIAALVSAGPISVALRDPSLEPLLRIAALDIPLVAAFMIASAILLGHHRFGRQALGMIAYSTAKFLAIGLLVWQGFSVPGALVGNALASLVGFAVMVGYWQRSSVRFKETLAEARGMGLLASPFFAQTLIAGVEYDASLWFVQAMAGSAAAGLFGGAAALADIPAFLFAGLSRALFPSVASANTDAELHLISRYATQGLRLAVLVTVLGVAVIAATGQELLTFIYTPEFAGAALPFTILMVASVGRNVFGVCSDVLMARDRRRSVLVILSVTTVAQLGLLYIAVSSYGMVGAAWAAAVTSLVGAAAAVYALRTSVGGRVWLTLARAGAAAAVVGLILAAVRPTGVWLFVAYAGAGVAYAALLAVLREFDRADIESMRAALGR